jgi:hypothetical protein
MKVTVFINKSIPDKYVYGYKRGDVAEYVMAYTDTISTSEGAALDRAFHVFNADPEMLRHADDMALMLDYRGRKAPSLSVGDVLLVDDTWYSVASVGFDRLDHQPAIKPLSLETCKPLRLPGE